MMLTFKQSAFRFALLIGIASWPSEVVACIKGSNNLSSDA
jgi:hypothetical protein